MATIYSVQASGGDYTTPQAAYDDNAGDITGDGNAPYIFELAAETFSGSLVMDQDSTTDATHYFHFRAQEGAEFDGDFDGSYPLLSPPADVENCIFVDSIPYTRFEHFVVGEQSSTGILAVEAVRVNDSDRLLCDTLGVFDVTVTGLSGGYIDLRGIRFKGTDTELVTIRNCAIGKLTADNTNPAGGRSRCFAMYIVNTDADVLNNATENIRCVSANGTAYWAAGIYASSAHFKIVNNVFGSLVWDTFGHGVFPSTPASLDLQYNATTDATGGTNSQDNITPGDEFVDTTPATLDLHMKSGGQCEDNGLDLLTGGYSNAPTEDCDNEARPNPGTWSIGIDHHPPSGHPAMRRWGGVPHMRPGPVNSGRSW